MTRSQFDALRAGDRVRDRVSGDGTVTARSRQVLDWLRIQWDNGCGTTCGWRLLRRMSLVSCGHGAGTAAVRATRPKPRKVIENIAKRDIAELTDDALRELVGEADVVFAVERRAPDDEHSGLVQGRRVLQDIAARRSPPRKLAVIGVLVDYASDELRRLLAAVSTPVRRKRVSTVMDRHEVTRDEAAAMLRL